MAINSKLRDIRLKLDRVLFYGCGKDWFHYDAFFFFLLAEHEKEENEEQKDDAVHMMNMMDYAC